MAVADHSGNGGAAAEELFVRVYAWAFVGVIVVVLTLHVGAGYRRLAKGRHALSAATAACVFDASGAAPLRAALAVAEEIHPGQAWRLRAAIGQCERATREAQRRARERLAELDAQAVQRVGQRQYRRALEAYATDDPVLRRVVREWRGSQLAELSRLASGDAATTP